MAVTIKVRVADLRRAYLTTDTKTGVADVKELGLFSYGLKIRRIIFRKNNLVDLIGEVGSRDMLRKLKKTYRDLVPISD